METKVIYETLKPIDKPDYSRKCPVLNSNCILSRCLWFDELKFQCYMITIGRKLSNDLPLQSKTTTQ